MSTNFFDLSAFNVTEDKESLVSLAKTAEVGERYEDMCECMKALVKLDPDLAQEERNLLSVAYKNVIGTRRAAWRALNVEISEQSGDNGMLTEYKNQVQKEVESTCGEMISLLSDSLIPKAKDKSEKEPVVFYLKMAGDYYRYLAEACSTEDEKHGNEAANFYKQAFDIAEEHLKATHPIRLGLALNYSVCYYEILKNQTEACRLAKSAFDQAISKLDKLDDNDYKDSTLIMQLLRDNLTLWTNSDAGEEGQVQVEDLSDEDVA